MKVLLVEDDAAIVCALTELLESEGMSVRPCTGQTEACVLLKEDAFDIALLDVTLAEGNGFAVCAAARASAPEMPVIFLTASDDEFSTVAGLDMGAADYVSKPFRPRELISRMRAACRRSDAADAQITVADVTLSSVSATVTKAGREIFLSALEYRLLLYFFQHRGKLVTRENLRDAIWDTAGEYVSDNALNVYVKRLREKVETDPAHPCIITTVRGMGYKIGE